MYSIKLSAIPWVAAYPIIENNQGLLIIVGSQQEQDLTNLIPVGTQFYLAPNIAAGGEDAGILRTCTSSVYDALSVENRFTFTPAPRENWSTLAKVIVQKPRIIGSPLPASDPVLMDQLYVDAMTPLAPAAMVMELANEVAI